MNAKTFICQLPLLLCCLNYSLLQPAVAQWYKHLDHLPWHQVLSIPACKDDGAAHVPSPTAADNEAVHVQSFSHSKYKLQLMSRLYCMLHWYDTPHRLAEEARYCIANDHDYSPTVDTIKRTVGLEYEYVLQRALTARGIHYEAETAMRERGLAKTPDILLPVPIAVKDSTGDWHIVKWIDSKAMFGYPDSFKEQRSALAALYQLVPYSCYAATAVLRHKYECRLLQAFRLRRFSDRLLVASIHILLQLVEKEMHW
eukprot:14267-Heterococcus_DN1.PRE.3